MKTAEELHREKIERETHEILALGQANHRLLSESKASNAAAAERASAAASATLEIRAEVASLKSQMQGCREDVSAYNGRFTAIETKLDLQGDDIAAIKVTLVGMETALANIASQLARRSTAGASVTTANAATSARKSRNRAASAKR